MEILVEPVTFTAYPEYGPSMMWNLKYGMRAGDCNFGIIGGVTNVDSDGKILVTEEEASALAQEYLDRVNPGYRADKHAGVFFGYLSPILKMMANSLGC
jgi:hypothetical protein